MKKKPNYNYSEYYYNNRDNELKKRLERRKLFPEKAILTRAKQHAKKKGIECTITTSDINIPKVCPLLGIPIIYKPGSKRSDNSASIDRIDPSIGYIPGNVWIISDRANRIKNNASLLELELLLKNLTTKIKNG